MKEGLLHDSQGLSCSSLPWGTSEDTPTRRCGTLGRRSLESQSLASSLTCQRLAAWKPLSMDDSRKHYVDPTHVSASVQGLSLSAVEREV